MGTRAFIAMHTGKTYRAIYTHWDGYPSHHGRILLGHYRTTKHVRELLSLGDLSVLGEQIGEKHEDDPKIKRNWCVAYERDKGHPSETKHRYRSLEDLEMAAHASRAEYIYLFAKNVWTMYDFDAWHDLYLHYITEKLTS